MYLSSQVGPLAVHCGDGAGGHLSRLRVRAGQVGCPCRPDAVAWVCVTSTGGVEEEEVIGPGKQPRAFNNPPLLKKTLILDDMCNMYCI